MLLWTLASVALADGCTKTSVGKLTILPEPGVLVLGDRKGTVPDLKRAKAIVSKLSRRGPVTVALQAFRLGEHQPALDALAEGRMTVDQIPSAVDWENTWGFPFEAYAPLLSLAGPDVHLVGIGQPYQPLPDDQTVPLPPGYIHILSDAMSDAPIPVDLETPYVAEVAWADHRFAKAAIDAWDGKGTLVIVVDRMHVEGGLGVGWQAQRLTGSPVVQAMLANGESRCYAGDQLLP
ncbi:MAG: ChaN family lipoprotein [Myxococcales bacterium]|nr:ChaN family lipoprotein [Myxococcales bacterium]